MSVRKQSIDQRRIDRRVMVGFSSRQNRAKAETMPLIIDRVRRKAREEGVARRALGPWKPAQDGAHEEESTKLGD
jgi:hypothetical protein